MTSRMLPDTATGACPDRLWSPGTLNFPHTTAATSGNPIANTQAWGPDAVE